MDVRQVDVARYRAATQTLLVIMLIVHNNLQEVPITIQLINLLAIEHKVDSITSRHTMFW